MTWSHAAKTYLKLIIKAQNLTFWQIIDILWYVRHFHMYKEIDIPRLNKFMQHVNINFPLS